MSEPEDGPGPGPESRPTPDPQSPHAKVGGAANAPVGRPGARDDDAPGLDLPSHALPPQVARHPMQDPERWSQRLTASRRMLETLICPVTQSRLDYDRAAQELISPKARLAFPIRDGIPVMLIDEARTLDE